MTCQRLAAASIGTGLVLTAVASAQLPTAEQQQRAFEGVARRAPRPADTGTVARRTRIHQRPAERGHVGYGGTDFVHLCRQFERPD